ncbi:hypothetical protein [Bremerella alba]|uniref:Uncharacterized protein n=1 Tax=Bremerella alba TaxID=980252 RepID=A0A7V8V372_9BACT|nr:hypothetical protein [Bremerella alba]MBA2114108.1 hypothetical protein [Bremerella alba]
MRYRRVKARDRVVLEEDVEQLISDEGLEEPAAQQDQLRAFEGCVEKLPDQRRRLVLNACSGEQSMKAIASDTGKSPEASTER